MILIAIDKKKYEINSLKELIFNNIHQIRLPLLTKKISKEDQ
jgi:hypothetical protein